MSTNNLFTRAVGFTDCHFGLRHNSAQHNEDIIDFIKWLILQAKERDADTCFFLGDFHHHRSNVNLQTQEYMLEAMHLLNDNFTQTYFLVGNHDLYFRENRSVTSSRFASLFPNIVLVDKPLIKGDVALVPWMIEDEWKDISKIKSKYLFGHLELPGFKMNAMVEMPDHGHLNAQHFSHQDYVFSGHFHKRQTKGKISYIGNPFGHNYSDVWDFERGGVFLDWGKEPEFLDYTGGPRFININLAALLSNPDFYLKPKTYLQVTLDIDVTYEEALFLRETFLSQYDVREFKLIRGQDDELTQEYDGDITFKTVDQIVIESISTIDSDSFSSDMLRSIYESL